VAAGRSRLLAPLLVLACLILAPARAAAESTPSPAEAVQMLNQWRAQVGVPSVTENPAESEGCRAHANYYRLNHEDQAEGHYEVEGLPGYTPAGDAAAGSSVLSFGSGASNGPFAWEGAVYHRSDLLNPRLATTGFWSEFGLGCMGVFGIDDSRTTPTLTAYPYPYDGEQGIETSFGCEEIPDPCESVPGNDGHTATGFISSVQFNGPWPRILNAHVDDAQLAPEGGGPLSVTPLTGSITAGFGVIPDRPLAEGTWYTGQANGTLNVLTAQLDSESVPFNVSWRFRTAIVARDPGLLLKMVHGRPHVVSDNPGAVGLVIRDGSTRRLSLTLHHGRGQGYEADALGAPPRTVSWKVCASQPADAEGRWKPAESCLDGAPIRLDVDVLYASKYLVRLRIKAPSPAWGRVARVTMWPVGGAPPAHARVRLQGKSRLDLPGISRAGARLRVEVGRFRRQSIPQRVLPVAEAIHWAAAPPSG
jgi:hypothetical protein